MNKLVEIAQAWITSLNPSEEQKILAEQRMNVCLGNEELGIPQCDFLGVNIVTGTKKCQSCGCPIGKKIFTPVRGIESCPQGKWVE